MRTVALAMVTAFVIAACHNVRVKPEPTGADLSSCQMVEHFMGKTCVPQKPQRIISLYTTPLANLLALGIEPIAITPATGIEAEFPPYLADKVKGVEVIDEANYDPNLEKLLN
ncbi:MAG: ABC transporter substrate-binding protein [Acaryochloridaceae cyanobacterium CSU_3_4]|nr:ABC transporter substrate-binding protein [Acaryochloridaceae cyanobacterium CSU_3_4]